MKKALIFAGLFAAFWTVHLATSWGADSVAPRRFVTTPALENTSPDAQLLWKNLNPCETLDYDLFWRGKAEAPRAVQVVFDFQVPTRVEALELDVLRGAYNDLSEVAVFTREESKRYSVAARIEVPKRDPFRINLSLSAKPVRFVKLRLIRRDNHLNIGIKRIRFIGTSGASQAGGLSEMLDPAEELTSEGELLDEFGQYLYEDWPEKIRSRDDLLASAISDEPGDLLTDTGLDDFGGKLSLGRHKATGFFRLTKIDDVWWFVSPQGHPFFLKGVAATDPNDPSYATSVSFTPGKPRQIFGKLPEGTSLSNRKISFLVANLRQKYGQSFEGPWSKLMMRRFNKWGFNASGKWSKGADLRLPFITVLTPAVGVKRIKWAADPFDESFETMVRNGVKDKLGKLKDSPWVIGHTFESESGWTTDIVNGIFALPLDAPARRAFTEFVSKRLNTSREKNNGHNKVERDVREMLATAKSLPRELREHAPDFIRLASDRYYTTVSRIIRELAPNHLFLGSSLTPGWRSSFEWEEGSVRHVDALSFDVYAKSADWIKRYTAFDKPILVLEFGFACPYRGMDFFPSASAESEDHRGRLFAETVGELAGYPQVVGTNWFLLYDQPVGGNGNGTKGENYNLGLINQQDVPYRTMLTYMTAANLAVYEWHMQSKQPASTETR